MFCETSSPLGDSLQSFVRGGSARGPTSYPFYIPIGQKRYTVTLLIPFIEKGNPFHIPTTEEYIPFLNPWNKLNEQYYGKTSSITRRSVNHKNTFHRYSFPSRQISLYPFIYLNL